MIQTNKLNLNLLFSYQDLINFFRFAFANLQNSDVLPLMPLLPLWSCLPLRLNLLVSFHKEVVSISILFIICCSLSLSLTLFLSVSLSLSISLSLSKSFPLIEINADLWAFSSLFLFFKSQRIRNYMMIRRLFFYFSLQVNCLLSFI